MARDAEATRRRILSVALSLFREHGFAETTMRRIASDCGLSLGAAYHHFASKQDIVRAYYEQQMEEHEAATRDAWAPEQRWLERASIGRPDLWIADSHPF